MNKKFQIVFFFLCWGLFFLVGFIWANHQRPAGDEPHYLIIAQSLIKDHDLDLKNNYDQKDYQNWGYPTETLDRHISVNTQGDKEYSGHNIGWPLVFSPFWDSAGRNGLIFFTSLIAAALVFNLYLLIKMFTQNNFVVLVISVIMGFSAPILIYSTQIFNEIFAALLVLYAFRSVIKKPENTINQILPVLAISFLPWLHVKYLLISLILLILWIINNWRQKRIFLAVIYVISLIILGCFFRHWYGSFLPSAQYPQTLVFEFARTCQGIAALFLDRTFGLFIYAPVYFLALSGFYFLYQKEKLMTLKLLAVFLSLFLIQAINATMIGWAPAGRFLVVVLPLLALPLAETCLYLKRWGKTLFWLLALWGFWAGYILITNPNLNYSVDQPGFLSTISPSFIHLEKYFPSLLAMEHYPDMNARAISITIFWLIVIFGINLIIIWQKSKYKIK